MQVAVGKHLPFEQLSWWQKAVQNWRLMKNDGLATQHSHWLWWLSNGIIIQAVWSWGEWSQVQSSRNKWRDVFVTWGFCWGLDGNWSRHNHDAGSCGQFYLISRAAKRSNGLNNTMAVKKLWCTQKPPRTKPLSNHLRRSGSRSEKRVHWRDDKIWCKWICNWGLERRREKRGLYLSGAFLLLKSTIK